MHLMSHYSRSRKVSCCQHWCLSIFDINYLYLIFEIIKFFSKASAFSSHLILRLFFRCSIIIRSYYEGINMSQPIEIVHLCQMTIYSSQKNPWYLRFHVIFVWQKIFDELSLWKTLHIFPFSDYQTSFEIFF